jgi:hypothetical protein
MHYAQTLLQTIWHSAVTRAKGEPVKFRGCTEERRTECGHASLRMSCYSTDLNQNFLQTQTGSAHTAV